MIEKRNIVEFGRTPKDGIELEKQAFKTTEDCHNSKTIKNKHKLDNKESTSSFTSKAGTIQDNTSAKE